MYKQSGKVTRKRQTAPAADSVDLVALLHRVGHGNQRAFACFYQLTSARVYGLVRKIIRDPCLSEDTTQEIYLRVWNDAGAYDPSGGTPLVWLMTRAHHHAVNKVRQEQQSTFRQIRPDLGDGVVDYDDVAETVARRWETAGHLRALTRIQRESLELAYCRGLTYRDAAAVLNVPAGTAKSRIRDALLRLENCLADP